MTLQRVSFVVPGGELEGTLHLPPTRAVGGVAVVGCAGWGACWARTGVEESARAAAIAGQALVRA